MSAFVVTYKTIDNILSMRLNHDILAKCCYLKSEFDSILAYGDDNVYKSLDELGKEFLHLNCLSVAFRYDETEAEIAEYGDYITKYQFNYVNVNIKQAIKSLNCLMYQSCEILKYKENKTYQKMEQLKKYLMDTMLYIDEEYQNAKWSDDYEIFGVA